MNYHWLIKNKAEDLIIFFNGWSMDANPYRHLNSTGYDVLILSDYRSLTMPQEVLSILQPYKALYLVAYSLGVWVSQHLLNRLPDTPAYSLAINGTLNPIDDRYGIPVKAYDQMIETFNERAIRDFQLSLFNNSLDASRFNENRPDRHWQDQLEELVKLKEAVNADPLDRTTGQFDTAIISSQDAVISARNQLRFWKDQCTVKMMDFGHFPFYRWTTWEALINEAQSE